MAVLIYSEIETLMLDRAVASASTGAPVSTAEKNRLVDEAYVDIYEVSGGGIKKVASATAWTSAQVATGVVQGILTDIREPMHLFATATSGSIGVPGTDSEVTLPKGGLPYINFLRQSSGHGTYSVPKMAAIVRLDSVNVAADVGKVVLEYWPSVTGFYFPLHYVPMFTPLAGSANLKPNVTDLESRDIGLIAAARLAISIDRQDLVPGILADISQRTAKGLAEKLKAMMSAAAA